MTGHPEVRLERRDAVALLTLDRPERRNALRLDAMRALAEALDRLAAEAAIRVVVVTGTPPAFCAGEDLDEALAMMGQPARLVATASMLQGLTRRLVAMPQVVVAAVNGPAVGLGAELAIAMDLRLAARSAWFAFPECERGLFHTNGVTWLLPRIVGLGPAADWMLTARRVMAEEARAAGLVTHLEDDDALLERALELAERLARLAPLSLRQLKRLLHRSFETTLEQALTGEEAALARCVASEDAFEGMRAFLERRTPEFRGR
jgi:enoyl-CoA hydratase/carnithine racemase